MSRPVSVQAGRTALFVSPHLDDVVFSCGGLAALLADGGWRTVLATVFTRSVVPASGFALACQLDKGLPADIDYMALRRDEDARAADILSFTSVQWLDLLEAPHRGYDAPPALFGALRDDDAAAGADVTETLRTLDRVWAPDLVLAPQGLGNHVDHQLVVDAARQVFDAARLVFYRDTPYAIRQQAASPLPGVPAGPAQIVPIGDALARKTAAAAAYVSQIGYQFGGAETCIAALSAFAHREGAGVAAERFLGADIASLIGALAP